MLDETEFMEAARLYRKAFDTKHTTDLSERFTELFIYYFRLTGEIETEPNAIMHHRIALYGPPCEKCGKPYRTSKASFCAACGNKRNQHGF